MNVCRLFLLDGRWRRPKMAEGCVRPKLRLYVQTAHHWKQFCRKNQVNRSNNFGFINRLSESKTSNLLTLRIT